MRAAGTMPAMATLTAAPSLCVSVVVYHSDLARLEETLAALLVAVQKAREAAVLTTVTVLVVDNSVCRVYHQALHDTIGQLPWERTEVVCRVLQAAANLGYGAGHNMALEHGASDCHLVLNPDIVTDPQALVVGLGYLSEHPHVVLACPRGELADGSPAYLSKRMPTVLVLALRAFAPAWLQARFSARLATYAMHDVQAAGKASAVPLASGCFMLVRGAALRRVGGFDAAFFLYFEDYDLSLRLAALGGLHYLPEMRVRHYGGETARKGLRHVAYFLRAGLRFFHRYGWRWL